MYDDTEQLIAAGSEALADGRWSSAQRSFEAVLERGDAPEALAGLGDALWWRGETDAAVHFQERAYAAFRRRPDPLQSVLIALSLYFLYRISLGNTAAARGWLGRAARLVDDCELAPLAGWVLLARAHDSDDATAAERWARDACDRARAFADADLELCALSQLGAALVQTGRVQEGIALLDEAMAGSLAGEGERPHTVVYASCNMISACSEIAAIERAAQWIRAADRFTHRYGCAHLYTHCRTYYGGILFATGDWPAAERELKAALGTGRSAERALYGEALARLAQLRLAQGRPEEAERLLEGYEDDYTSACTLAALRLARGEPDETAGIVRRRLRELDEHERTRTGSYRAGAAVCVETAALLELLVEAELDRARPDAAAAAAQRLRALAETLECELIAARAQRALARVPLATGDSAAALPHVERAVALFARLAMPYETARTRVLLTRALSREQERDTAVAHARAALTAFDALGATRDADAAVALLRALGATAARRAPRSTAALTRRELEVLALLGEGLSNRELAERLFLTRKTVEHHVHNVLTKLGLRSRAEAAAYAVRRHTDSAST